ncbi:hypothetical protein ACTJKZ_03685 [Pantoea sp. 22096]|uniref:hypothetical protein n=1 Tax=Pantoea sp. 22096 TaxID=3453873 RepID=UPI003F8506DF
MAKWYEGELTAYAFVDSIEPAEQNNRYSRLNIIFDSASEQRLEDAGADENDYQDLYFVRVMTTHKRFFEKFNIDTRNIREGQWFKIFLKKEPGEPPAWILPSNNSFSGPYFRTNIKGFERVTKRMAFGKNNSSVEDTLKLLCSFTPRKYIKKNSTQFNNLNCDIFIRKVDVGQGCCAAFHVSKDVASEIIGYYDVGVPLPFNMKTFPKVFNEQNNVPNSGFVLLSHWDYDHYFMAMNYCSKLQSLTWYAPSQKSGPVATTFKKNLGSNLNIVTSAQLTFVGKINYKKSSYAGKDANNSGYYCVINSHGIKTLLPGDIDYEYISTNDKNDLGALAISHHGGKGSEIPPSCSKKPSNAVVSYGFGNSYHHPYPSSITAHQNKGWIINATATITINSVISSRGDKWLY